MYENFKASVLGKAVTEVQGVTNPYGIECVTLIWLYASELFPGVSFKNTVGTGNANTLMATASSAHFTKIYNNHSDVNQLPEQGDIMVFTGTPATGYSDTYPNPYGHTGICDSATARGYALLSQNSPEPNEAPNVFSVAWSYRPCMGWLRPIENAVVPTPTDQYYTVVRGDTVDAICERYKLTISQFKTLNPSITNLNVIYVGEKVRVA